MTPTSKTTFNAETDVAEPIEIRIEMVHRSLVLSAWRNEHGNVSYSLSSSSGGLPESLSNLQSEAIYPRKAFSGWQREVITFVESGLGRITQIR